MPAPQPIAVFGDTAAIVAALFAARLLLVAVRGERRWATIAAKWMRRVAVVSVLLLALRLISVAVMRPDSAGPVLWVAVAILASGAAILMLDRILMDLIRPGIGRRQS